MPAIPTHAKAVFFDAVGTVLIPDPGAVAVYTSVARELGIAADAEAIRARLVASFRAEEAADEADDWRTSEEREIARWRAIVAHCLPGSPPALFERLYQHFARPDAWCVPADAAATFASLAGRGLKLGLGSNYDSRLESVIAGRPELAPLAGRVVISSRIGFRKPARRFFDAVIAAAGCEPGEIVFVGDDRSNDFDGATAAGLHAVLLDPAGRHPDVAPRVTALSGLSG